MKKGDSVELKMQKILCSGGKIDTNSYHCIVSCYNKKEECIYLVLQSNELNKLSLDAVYKCEVQTAGANINCTGRIKERYCGKEGNILKFHIKNGFYKINIKSLTNK